MMKQQETNTTAWFTLFQQGDERAFNYVFGLHKDAIYFYCRKLLDSDSEAEDVTATALFSLWKAKKEIQNPDHIRNFLYKVAKNECINLMKANHRQQSFYQDIKQYVPQMEDEIDLGKIHAEMMETIFLEVENLPPGCRKVFDLLFVENKTPLEASQILGIDRKTVYMQRRIALNYLKTALLKKGINITFIQLTILFSISCLQINS